MTRFWTENDGAGLFSVLSEVAVNWGLQFAPWAQGMRSAIHFDG